MATKVSWAVLLCKFSDSAAEPFTREVMEKRFTVAGQGTPNIVDYWSEVSYGNLDISGSKVFGWLPLDKKRTEYTGSGPNQAGRDELVVWAKNAAIKQNVPLTQFDGVIVITNVPTDMFGFWRAIVLDENSVDLTGACHEMGHGYGFNHSRSKSYPGEDYKDPWDIMSAYNVFPATGENGLWQGPFMNAALTRSAGWLPTNRIWTYDETKSVARTQKVTLRPLHRPDMSGYLAAEFADSQGQFSNIIVEFRTPERWDGGIGAPVVLVHTYEGGCSYLVPNSAGKAGLTVGDTIHIAGKGATGILGAGLNVTVLDIDVVNHTATLEFQMSRGYQTPSQGPASWLTGVDSGGGGILILNGRVIRIGPRQPSWQLAQLLELYHLADELEEEELARRVKRETLTALNKQILKELRDLRAEQ